MQAIILDTETHTLNGLPIEIAYAPIEINAGKLTLDKSKLFDQLYQVGTPILRGYGSSPYIRVRFRKSAPL
jgi:exodeoxyribonuclease X